VRDELTKRGHSLQVEGDYSGLMGGGPGCVARYQERVELWRFVAAQGRCGDSRTGSILRPAPAEQKEMRVPAALLILILSLALTAWGQQKPRARDVGVPFEGTPGALNAITDVAGVEGRPLDAD
jgi:hypothetical protein